MDSNKLVTAAEAGMASHEQLKIILQTLINHDGSVEMKEIYKAIETKMIEKGFQLSEQGKASLRTYVNRDAVNLGYVMKDNKGWKITLKGIDFLNDNALIATDQDMSALDHTEDDTIYTYNTPPRISLKEAVALGYVVKNNMGWNLSLKGKGFLDNNEVIENDQDTLELDIYADGSIYPYDTPHEVNIRGETFSIFGWMRKLRRKQLIINPEFQRKLVWKPIQKSLFIESILLNIPLPPLYVNQRIDGKYIIIDGLQRTTTLDEFIHNDGFKLQQLQILTKLNGLSFSNLQPALQTKIEDKKFLVYVIKPSVPLPMVYNIFHRINTGGTQLTRQEIRNSLYIGAATQLLKELAEQDYFKKAIDGGISDKRMKDREAILRYLAFKILDYKRDYKGDMDAFLGKALDHMNDMDQEELQNLKQDFERVMRLTYAFFGDKNFRFPTSTTRGRVNIAIMESVSYFFSLKSDTFFNENKQKILTNYNQLLNNTAFRDAVRYSTGNKIRVTNRFDLAQQILGQV